MRNCVLLPAGTRRLSSSFRICCTHRSSPCSSTGISSTPSRSSERSSFQLDRATEALPPLPERNVRQSRNLEEMNRDLSAQTCRSQARSLRRSMREIVTPRATRPPWPSTRRDIAKRMGLSDEEQQLVHLCGLVHDIGKVGLPPGLLGKGWRADARRAPADGAASGNRRANPLEGGGLRRHRTHRATSPRAGRRSWLSRQSRAETRSRYCRGSLRWPTPTTR